MTFLGLAHGVGGHHASPLAHPRVSLPGHHGAGHASGHGAHHAAQHSSTPAQHHQGLNVQHASFDPWRLLLAVSPLDIFSVALGAGAAGTLLKIFFSGPALALCAIGGGAVFAFGVVRPLMGFLMGFASRPSEGLEGEVSSLGEAITRFDSQGRGLIKLVLDEQHVQLLGTLDKSEQEAGVQVLKGEKVVIISVDATRNTCQVSRDLAPNDVGFSESASQVKS
jgi:hypothetical protein